VALIAAAGGEPSPLAAKAPERSVTSGKIRTLDEAKLGYGWQAIAPVYDLKSNIQVLVLAMEFHSKPW
jgi:hypothetical protein